MTSDGAKWCRQWSSESRLISSIEEAFVNPNLPMPPGPSPLWGPGGVPGEWSFVCGFLKPLRSENEWQVRMRGAFTVPVGMLIFKGNRSKLPSRSLGSFSTSMLGWLIENHETTDLPDQIRERGTHLTTTARQGGKIFRT